jgi:EAL domain-containing protein (putative c-di-GMP-specific phosphodiesterase class I)
MSAERWRSSISGVWPSAHTAWRNESIMESSAPDKRATGWCLESTADGGRSLERVQIQNNPFRIGRLDELDLTLPFQSISKHHAEILLDDDSLTLRDLRSTNGTFVNRRRVEEDIALQEGDILHFAEIEFRVGRSTSEALDDDGRESGTLSLSRLELPQHFIGGTRELAELIEREMATIVFQSVVSLPSGEVMAYECLGRGTHGDLPRNPAGLFRVAETMDREADLSRLFRRKAALLASQAEDDLPLLFLNTHPNELGEPELVDSLREVREIVPKLALALEIHEGALAEPQVIAELKKELDELEIHLALDDFGLGERFLQLAEVPPDYLKFDISLVKNLVDASSSKRRLLAMLMAAVREVGAQPIAEGIETEKEAGVCTMMGFTLAQGYLYGDPLQLSDIVDLASDTIEQPVPKILKEERD